MEEKLAIFTAGEYYLLPENFKSFEDFAQFITSKASHKLKLTKLTETKCMAPYFTYEAQIVETITLSSDNPIFKTRVFLLSKAEYHEKLVSVIKKMCLDCENFIDDGDYENLNGHHEEISLDGVCLKKREKGFVPYYVLAYAINDLFDDFNNAKDEIEKLVESGKITEAKDKIFGIIVEFMPIPIDIVLLKRKKVFECYFPTFNDDAWGLIVYNICKNWNGKALNWKFYPYLPHGIMPPNPDFTPTVFENQTMVSVINKREITFWLKEDNLINFANIYQFLCNDIGEDKFLRGTADCFVKFDTEKTGNEIQYAEFKKSILKTKDYESLSFDNSPVPVWTSVASYDENGMPNKLASYCSNLFFNCFDHVESTFLNPFEYGNIFANMGISVAKLSINLDSAVYLKNVTNKILLALQKMLNNDFSINFARESLLDKFNIYFLVFNNEKFLYELKRHSPIFDTYPASLDIANHLEVKKYEVNFMFKLVSSSKLNLIKKD